MQQFFMIPDLRIGILKASIDLKQNNNNNNPNNNNNNNNNNIKDEIALLFEMGKMFSWLQESERQYYDPIDFVKVYKVI